MGVKEHFKLYYSSPGTGVREADQERESNMNPSQVVEIPSCGIITIRSWGEKRNGKEMWRIVWSRKVRNCRAQQQKSCMKCFKDNKLPNFMLLLISLNI